MKRGSLKLKDCGVDFNQSTHTYTLDGKVLQGITKTLLDYACPGKYDGIPLPVLEEAARKGTLMHEQIETFETIFDGDKDAFPMEPSQELQGYISLMQENNLTWQRQEYLVTDKKYFASAIDMVCTNDQDEICLVDFKRTSKLYTDSVTWQQSIYAALFEKQNPRKKVKHIYVMHLREDKHKLVELKRHSTKEVDKLVADYLEGKEKQPEATDIELPTLMRDVELRYIEVSAKISALQEEQDALKQRILEYMKENRQDSIKTRYATYSYIQPSERKTFDSTKFKAEHPEEYNSYQKVSKTKETIKIIIK